MLLEFLTPILTPMQIDKYVMIKMLICVEDLLTDGESDDYGMYTKMGLRLYPKDPDFLQ